MSERGELTLLQPGRPDVDVAADLKARMRIALGPVVEVMAEARKAGMMINFTVGTDQLGRVAVTDVNVVKPL